MFKSSKTYTYAQGLSCCFRQWRAESHCRFLHGYALQVEIVFQAQELDERGWVVDFGGLDEVKAWLKKTFDHKTVVASDDPLMVDLVQLQKDGAADIVVIPSVGCEAFAKYIFDYAQWWLDKLTDRAVLESVTVREHGGNSASYWSDEAVDSKS